MNKKKKHYYVYILKCSDQTLYTGYTSDLKQRIRTHKVKLGAKYTRGRLPVKLIWQKKFNSKSKALRVEIKIKKLSREQKQKIIKGKELYGII